MKQNFDASASGERRCSESLIPETLRVLHINSGRLYGGVEAILVTLARLRHLCPEMDSQFGVWYEGRLSQELISTGPPVHLLGKVRVSRPCTLLQPRRPI